MHWNALYRQVNQSFHPINTPIMSSVQSSDSTISSKENESLDDFPFNLEEVTEGEGLEPGTPPPLNEQGPKVSKQASFGELLKKKVKYDSSGLICIIHDSFRSIWYA